jgi:hypothetical protein
MRQVDDQLEFGRLLDRNIGGFRPEQHLVDMTAGAPIQVLGAAQGRAGGAGDRELSRCGRGRDVRLS